MPSGVRETGRPAPAVAGPVAAVAVVAVKLPAADRLLIAYSGGKDSLATLDLCVRAGKDVEAFFMYFVPGMDYTEYWCSYAERKFGVKVHRAQHYIASYYLNRGIFCDVTPTKELKQKDVEAMVKAQTGREWVGYGYKLNDSPSRRSYMTFMSAWCSCGQKPPTCQCKPRDGICDSLKRFSPIMNWKDSEVFAYLSARKILVPEMSRRKVNGVALLPEVMAEFREKWPADYRRILEVFPFASAQADRAGLVKAQRQTARAAHARAETGSAPGPVGASQPAPATMGSPTP